MTMPILDQRIEESLRNQIHSLSGPAYIYFAEQISKDYDSLQAAVGHDVTILYSLKANPHPAVCGYLSQLGCGADVSSFGELKVALESGFSPKKISFVGPGKSNQELQSIFEHKILSLAESLQELLRFNDICKEHQQQRDVALRFSLNSFVNSSGRSLEGYPNQFGIDEEDLQDSAEVLKKCSHLNFKGIHIHCFSQFLDPKLILQNLQRIFDFSKKAQQSLGPLKVINLGGGFGVPLFKDQMELNLSAFTEGWLPLKKSFKVHFPDAKLFFESGRFLTAGSGYYLTKILYKKLSRKKTYLVCEGGLNHHLASVGIGQIVRKPYPISILTHNTEKNSSTTGTEVVTVVGPTCYAMDVMGEDLSLTRAEVGDYVCIHQSGAYGPSFSPVNFLSREPAEEIFISSNHLRPN